jgi:GrpB-like predicted nucleotidyltransferase (UPF0157 family)
VSGVECVGSCAVPALPACPPARLNILIPLDVEDWVEKKRKEKKGKRGRGRNMYASKHTHTYDQLHIYIYIDALKKSIIMFMRYLRDTYGLGPERSGTD